MAKRIKMILLTILMIIPVLINASKYDTEVSKANSLLNKENYKNSYEKYIVNGSNIKFEYSNGTNKTNSSFTKGGFISLEEFKLTTVRGVSYLFDGVEYWTLTKSGSNVYAITYDDINTAKNASSNYGGRVTEFVNPSVTMRGEGKLNNPWTFDSVYKVTAVVDSRYADIESGNNVYVKGGCTSSECTAKIKIREKIGYRYITNDCNGVYDDTTKLLTVKNVKRDTRCNVVFGKGIFVITLTGGTPNKIYLKYGENYYKEFALTNVIKKIDNVTAREGYTFIGYYYNGHKIINGDNEGLEENKRKILSETVSKKYITGDVTLEPSWQATQYKVIFDCNGGNTPPTTQTPIYGNSFTLTSSVCKKSGSVQNGWNTKNDGTGESWTVGNKTNITWNISHDVMLYAVWGTCPAGTYLPANSDTCTNCPAGTYSATAGSSSCTSCPSGYTSDAGAKQESECYINVEAGKYLGTARETTQTKCGNGYWKAAHKVNYGSTSSCTQCPANYRDGTEIVNMTSESACLNNVAAGYRVATAGGAETVCDNGYFKLAHSVTYGETSSCTQCPENYRDGKLLENKTAKLNCLNNVAAGYRVATENAAETICDNGYWNAAHSVKFGGTSTCKQCPANYRDGTLVTNKTAEDKCLNNVAAGYRVATAKAAEVTCPSGYTSTQHSVTYGNISSCTAIACTCPSGYNVVGGQCQRTVAATCTIDTTCESYPNFSSYHYAWYDADGFCNSGKPSCIFYTYNSPPDSYCPNVDNPLGGNKVSAYYAPEVCTCSEGVLDGKNCIITRSCN